MTGKKESGFKTVAIRITLTEPEMLCLNNLKKAGSFRSASHTIGEVLRFVQALRDNPTALKILGSRFGIN